MIFLDKELQKEFDLNGFVKINFLTLEQIQVLKDGYFQNVDATPLGFSSTSFIKDNIKRKFISDSIQECIQDSVDTYFTNYVSLGASFLSKTNGIDGVMHPHQDWTIVDENHFDSMTIWMPLQDVDEENGALRVLPGSHKFSSQFRGPTLVDPYKDIHNLILEDSVLVPLKVGQALVFSHALLHASSPNHKETTRIAATFGMIPNKAKLVFYHSPEELVLEKYEVDYDFFQTYNTNIGVQPKGLSPVSVLKYKPLVYSKEDYSIQKLEHNQKKQKVLYTMKTLFKNKEHQDFFEEQGYIVLPVLNNEEVKDLKNYYESLGIVDEKKTGFHVSMDIANKELCREIRSKIWSVSLPKLDSFLSDYKPFVASFTAKEPNKKGIVPPHQDWSFVDNEEDGFCSITCWIALVDTTLDNGALGVVKGSHSILLNNRSSPSPQTPVPLSDHLFSLFPYVNLIEMKAGEMLMFDNRTFHASPPNITNETRLAVGIGITQSDAQLVHYYLKPDQSKSILLKYNVDEEFYLKYDNSTLSKLYDEGKLIEGYGEPKELIYHYEKFNQEEMINLVKAKVNEPDLVLANRLQTLFGENNIEKNSSKSMNQNSIGNQKPGFFEVYTPLNIAKEILIRLKIIR